MEGEITRSKEGVPQWSGDSRSFQDYEEQAMRWEQSIAYHKRYLCGPRLQAELQGTAKKLVVGKRPDWLSFAGGVEHLLDYLRQRLGKPQIPDLSDYLNQYFRQSKRKKFESMNNYIVRKVEVYARARQALARVQRHYGHRAHEQRSRGRPERGGWRYGGYSSWWPSDAGDTQVNSAVASQADATEPVPGEDERQENNTEPEEDNYQGWWNWARWGQDQWSSQSNYTSENADWVDTTDELLPDFLQGWYLLADANLDTQERNLVQTAVAGDFSLERIAQELRSQFPEMDLMRRDQSHKPSSFWQEEVNSEDDDKDKSNDVANLLREGMNEEGIYLISEAEQEASGALVAMQQAKRTLREARAKQHQVRLSRQYYKVGSEKLKVGTTSSSSTSVGIKCFKCGGNHKIANCPDRQGPGKAEAHHADQEEAPFVCYLQDTDIEASAMSANDMSTAEATRLGYGVIDGGATRTLASVQALEALVQQNVNKHKDGRVLQVDTTNQPTFGFGNSTRDRCMSTTKMGITAANKNGELMVHTLDRGDGPILVSIATLRALGAIIDFENDLIVFRALDEHRAVPLTRSTTGHQLISLSDDLYKDAIKCTERVRSLKELCENTEG